MANIEVIKANPNRINRKTAKTLERMRVAAYCRVSTDTEEQLTSYNSQVSHYRTMVESEPKWELVDIYADEGITGTQTDKRTEFQRMINDAMADRIDMIITKSISRFARNTLDTLKYVRMLKERDVAILFEKENINTLTMNGEMLLVILSSIAQQESESISANVKMGLKMKMKRGEMVGYNGCLGYDYNPIDKTITINEEEAVTVRYIFQRYVEGAGAFVIAKELSKMQAKTKRSNTKWHESAVRGIIKNEKYKGDLLLGKTFTVDPLTHRRLENMGEEEKYYITGNHEPLISEELFNEAHKVLAIRSSKHNNKGRTDKYSKKYAFSSIIKCGFCGGTAIRRTWHSRKDHEKFVWACMTSVKEGKKYCPDSKAIDEKEIEQAFIDSFNMLCSKNRDVIEEFLSEMEESLGKLDVTKELKKVDKEIEAAEKRVGKLVDLRVDEAIDRKTYEEKYTDLSFKLEKLKADRLALQVSMNDTTDLRKRMKVFRGVFEMNEPLKAFDRLVFESVVEQIILGKVDDNGEKKPHYLTFVFKTGFKTEAEGKSTKGKATGKVNNDSMKSNDEKACSHSANDTRGVCGEVRENIGICNIND